MVQGLLDSSQHFNSFTLAKTLKEMGGLKNKQSAVSLNLLENICSGNIIIHSECGMCLCEL